MRPKKTIGRTRCLYVFTRYRMAATRENLMQSPNDLPFSAARRLLIWPCCRLWLDRTRDDVVVRAGLLGDRGLAVSKHAPHFDPRGLIFLHESRKLRRTPGPPPSPPIAPRSDREDSAHPARRDGASIRRRSSPDSNCFSGTILASTIAVSVLHGRAARIAVRQTDRTTQYNHLRIGARRPQAGPRILGLAQQDPCIGMHGREERGADGKLLGLESGPSTSL